MKMRTVLAGPICLLMGLLYPAADASPQKPVNTLKRNSSDSLLYQIMAAHPEYFGEVIKHAKDWKIQIIYTQVTRGKKNKIKLTDHTFNTNPSDYYYPASTVKLPIAILALQKLHELNIPGLNRNTTMITEADGPVQTGVSNDPTSWNGKPSIAQYIKKMLLVSDNDAFNRLYEFLGQEYINNTLRKMGYEDVRIIHRLSISLDENANRHTNPVLFTDDSGRNLYYKPAELSKLDYSFQKTKVQEYRMGKGYIKGVELVNQPFDFSQKNRLPLQDLHAILTSIIFPGAVPEKQRFGLTADDYAFLRKYMSMQPGESRSPVYDTATYWDNYVKFIYYGAEKTKPDPGIRIFNKPGDAYGFMIDASYIADFKNSRECLVSAVIYCNSDGIFNDDKYDYQTIGEPFMKNLGRVLHENEMKRTIKKQPGWQDFRFNYKD